MPFPPQTKEIEPEFQISFEDAAKQKNPGYTVDLLLAEGNIEGAKAELERLVLEGLNSDNPIEATPQFWDDMRKKLHLRAQRNRTRKSA